MSTHALLILWMVILVLLALIWGVPRAFWALMDWHPLDDAWRALTQPGETADQRGDGNVVQGAVVRDELWRQRWRQADRLADRSWPLHDEKGDPLLGPAVPWTESAVVPSDRRTVALTLPMDAIRQHLVVVGDTGAGKTIFLERLATTLVLGGDNRLVVHIDAKGSNGSERRGVAWCTRLRQADPSLRTARWPVPDRLHFWSMSADEMLSTLYAFVPPTHPHFDTRREASLRLAVCASGGPPRSGAELLQRLDARWLRAAYATDRAQRGAVEAVCAKTNSTAPAVEDTALKYANLLARMDGCFDGDLRLNDLDAVYAVVPGTRRGEVARAQASGLISMITDALAGANPVNRPLTVIIDEYSAVSGAGGVGIVSAVERLRSLGGSVIVAAQSWESLADAESERRRLVAGASGGVVLMRTVHADPLIAMAGTARALVSADHGGTHMDRIDQRPVVDPARVRTFRPGDIAHIRHGVAKYGRVTPL